MMILRVMRLYTKAMTKNPEVKQFRITPEKKKSRRAIMKLAKGMSILKKSALDSALWKASFMILVMLLTTTTNSPKIISQ